MTIKAPGSNSKGKGGRGKNIKYKTEWGYGAHIPVELNGVRCLALIDTGASRSCMSSTQYKSIGSPPLGAFAPGGPFEISNRDFHGGMGIDWLPSPHRAEGVCPVIHSM